MSVAAAGWSREAIRFVALNVAGGAAVLASYAWGLAALGDDTARAWGGVPSSLHPLYTGSMLLAAAGYFPMTSFVLDGLRSRSAAMHTATPLYAAILVCSALWLPLTCAMLDEPSALLWWSIRLDLAVVGLAALGVLRLIVFGGPSQASLRWKAAVAGAAAFSFQTALLDAIVWPAYFPAGG